MCSAKLGPTLKAETADVATLWHTQLALTAEALERCTPVAEHSKAGQSAVHLAPLVTAITPSNTLLQESVGGRTLNSLHVQLVVSIRVCSIAHS